MQDPNKIVIVGTIYALHSGDGVVRYIGLTALPPVARLRRHCSEARTVSDSYKNRWIRSIGIDNLHISILAQYENIPYKELGEHEIVAIAEAKAKGFELTNTHKGGARVIGYKHTNDRIAKIGEASTGRVMSAESRKKLSESRKGMVLSDEHKRKISETMSGRSHTAEHKEKIGAAHRGKTISPEARAKISASMHKRWHLDRNLINPKCAMCVL